jgi:hypothetical protein
LAACFSLRFFRFSSLSFLVNGLSFFGIRVLPQANHYDVYWFNNFPKLSVFPKRVPTFCAAHKLRRSFIAATCLHLPDKNQVILAIWALDLYGWQRLKLLILLADNRDSRL